MKRIVASWLAIASGGFLGFNVSLAISEYPLALSTNCIIAGLALSGLLVSVFILARDGK